MKINNRFKLIVTVAVSELAGLIGSLFTTPALDSWYAGLVKPAVNPPAWIFGPVWITLFALMGLAAFFIWQKGLERPLVKFALGWFVFQLVLNVLWSFIFFGLRSPGGAMVEIIFLWLAILLTLIFFARISRPAAWLLVPYLGWVSFAGYLNYSIWQLNVPANSGQTVFCTQEAKLCPDGSYVGRRGPKCEFSACQSGDSGLWKTTTDSQSGLTFRYPQGLTTTYIKTVDWPPRVQVLAQSFACEEAGAPTARAGQTARKQVGDRTYCVTTESEGAAGSIYTNYAYAFPWTSVGGVSSGGQTAIFTFSLRAPQCANYDEPQKTNCVRELAAFNPDSLVDRMVRSLKQ